MQSPNVYGSRIAGERVMSGIRAYLKDVLRLQVSAEKSAVARPWERKFLGYSFTVHHDVRLRIAPESVRRLRQRVRALLARPLVVANHRDTQTATAGMNQLLPSDADPGGT
jgi:hypothetical protein